MFAISVLWAVWCGLPDKARVSLQGTGRVYSHTEAISKEAASSLPFLKQDTKIKTPEPRLTCKQCVFNIFQEANTSEITMPYRKHSQIQPSVRWSYRTLTQTQTRSIASIKRQDFRTDMDTDTVINGSLNVLKPGRVSKEGTQIIGLTAGQRARSRISLRRGCRCFSWSAV